MTAVIWNSNRIARTAFVLASLSFATPTMAEEVNQISIYGEVAPRCWVAEPMKIVISNGAVQATGRAICNQARPLLASEVRMIGSDGLLIKRVPAAADRAAPLSTRTALEIVVTPQL
jgi:stage V sporulation protein SpoVS